MVIFMKRFISIFAAAALLLGGCAVGTTKRVIEKVPEETQAATINPDLDPSESMTLEEKVGQIFMVRCDSANMDAVLEKHPGGILMFGVDFDDLSADEVKDKIQGYKDALRIEPYIAVDEEGGTVVRVSSHSALSEVKYESPQHYYHQGGLDAVYANAAEKSDLLASLGINMNLAPVADVSTDAQDFIYQRALGEEARTTAEYVGGVVAVMREHNMYSCLKHFPGYGNNVDTHTGIAIDERSADYIRRNDFLPFESGIEAGADAVLVAHNIVNSMDSSCPASISPTIHGILRDELGFDGIIMTDDMSMDAMQDYETPYIKAVLAGNDMIIVTDFSAAYTEVLNAVKDGTIPETAIDTAVNRIVKHKLNQQR